ncbi:TPA: glycosyltransferase, partial [Streptococcus agalactiae]|nr:glycosyltransferase [Streptococcus agalactiae]
MKVNILMATYNGEKFLAQQIESIQKQTFKEWNLLIRDDGSSDKTCDII